MVKISKTRHITRRGVVKRNPSAIKGWKKTKDTRRSLTKALKSRYASIPESALYTYETWISENNKIELIQDYNPVTKKSTYTVDIFGNSNNRIDSAIFRNHTLAEKFAVNFMKNNIGTKLKGWRVIYYKDKKIIGNFKSIEYPTPPEIYRYARGHILTNGINEKDIKVDVNRIY